MEALGPHLLDPMTSADANVLDAMFKRAWESTKEADALFVDAANRSGTPAWLLARLRKALDAGNLDDFHLLVLCGHRKPDHRYVPLLLEALRTFEPREAGFEDIVELIGDAPTPEAMPMLRTFIERETFTNDERHLAEKALSALRNLGGEQARLIVSKATRSGNPHVSRWAQLVAWDHGERPL